MLEVYGSWAFCKINIRIKYKPHVDKNIEYIQSLKTVWEQSTTLYINTYLVDSLIRSIYNTLGGFELLL